MGLSIWTLVVCVLTVITTVDGTYQLYYINGRPYYLYTGYTGKYYYPGAYGYPNIYASQVGPVNYAHAGPQSNLGHRRSTPHELSLVANQPPQIPRIPIGRRRPLFRDFGSPQPMFAGANVMWGQPPQETPQHFSYPNPSLASRDYGHIGQPVQRTPYNELPSFRQPAVYPAVRPGHVLPRLSSPPPSFPHIAPDQSRGSLPFISFKDHSSPEVYNPRLQYDFRQLPTGPISEPYFVRRQQQFHDPAYRNQSLYERLQFTDYYNKRSTKNRFPYVRQQEFFNYPYRALPYNSNAPRFTGPEEMNAQFVPPNPSEFHQTPQNVAPVRRRPARSQPDYIGLRRNQPVVRTLNFVDNTFTKGHNDADMGYSVRHSSAAATDSSFNDGSHASAVASASSSSINGRPAHSSATATAAAKAPAPANTAQASASPTVNRASRPLVVLPVLDAAMGPISQHDTSPDETAISPELKRRRNAPLSTLDIETQPVENEPVLGMNRRRGNLGTVSFENAAYKGTENAVGDESTVIGLANAEGKQSTSIGSANSFGDGSTVIGITDAKGANTFSSDSAKAIGHETTVIGIAKTQGKESTSVSKANAVGDESTVFGISNAVGLKSASIGTANGIGKGSTVIGISSTEGKHSASVGNANVIGIDSTAIGMSTVTGKGSVSKGSATAIGDNSVAAGLSEAEELSVASARAIGDNTVAVGMGKTDGTDSVTLGEGHAVGHKATGIGVGTASGPGSSAVGIGTALGTNAVAIGVASAGNSHSINENAKFPEETINGHVVYEGPGNGFLSPDPGFINLPTDSDHAAAKSQSQASGGVASGKGSASERKASGDGPAFARGGRASSVDRETVIQKIDHQERNRNAHGLFQHLAQNRLPSTGTSSAIERPKVGVEAGIGVGVGVQGNSILPSFSMGLGSGIAVGSGSGSGSGHGASGIAEQKNVPGNNL